jgi:hypothetical protein
MKKKHRILYVLLGASVLGMALYAIRSHTLASNLQTAQLLIKELEVLKTNQRELVKIDSMLIEGNYQEAILSYEQTMQTQKELNMGIPLRIALAKRLLENDTAMASTSNDGSTMPDSTALIALGDNQVRALDSLQFALDKSRIQIQNLRNQLLEKSLGAYLRFKSNKGTPLHYVGEVKNGQANGKGIALLDTGSRYEGEWLDNQRHGEGTFYWPDGEKYTGEYSDDMRNGLGTYYWPNGEKYTGHWKDDKRNGQGTFYGQDGSIVTRGLWKNDKLQDPAKKSKRP